VVVRIKERRIFEGVCTPTALGVEMNVVDIPAEPEPFFVGGYLDLSELTSGDAVEIREYYDGKRFETGAYAGAQTDPILRFPVKITKKSYRVTLTQTSGTIRSFPFDFVQFLTEVV